MTKNKLVIVCTLVILAAIGLNALESIRAYNHVNSISIQNCEEIEVVKTAARETIEASQAFVQSSHVRSKAEKKASDQYYREVLDRFKERDCGSKFVAPKLKVKGPHKCSNSSSRNSQVIVRRSRSTSHRSSGCS